MTTTTKEQESKEEIERLRADLERHLRRIPERVCNGSIQTVQAFKAAHKAATKVLAARSVNAAKLRAVINSIT